MNNGRTNGPIHVNTSLAALPDALTSARQRGMPVCRPHVRGARGKEDVSLLPRDVRHCRVATRPPRVWPDARTRTTVDRTRAAAAAAAAAAVACTLHNGGENRPGRDGWTNGRTDGSTGVIHRGKSRARMGTGPTEPLLQLRQRLFCRRAQ